MNNKVVIARCPSYDDADVAVALEEAFRQLGGFRKLLEPGRRVVLKVNLLRGARPEQTVTTHPSVVKAVARATRAAGATPLLADSPGSGLPYTKRTLEKCYRRSGYLNLADEVGLELNYDTSSQTVRVEDARVAKRFNVITPVLEADAVINLCKLKTHAFTILTGAVKNLFGVLPGFDKPGYHARMRTVDNFADVLLDVAFFVKPVLNVMEAVLAMEGNGPGLGDARKVGLIMASPSALALDVAAGAITGLAPERHPVVRVAARRDEKPNRPEDLNVVGPTLETLLIKDWKWPPTIIEEGGFANAGPFQRFMTNLLRDGLSVQPRVRRERCTGCALCRESCPVGAISVINDKSYVDEKLCIRCYCCHEACAYDAVELRRSLLHRLVGAVLT
ncbi:MAG: DUF362 domain-containing protein [candidate division Zixibacteria bacterium]|nr:DUF362 domain-containing protein [candidate division Zixibacteria bacterium]